MKAIYKRELASYFRSPVGWIAIAVYAIIGGFYFSFDLSSSGAINIGSELGLLQLFFVITIPLITMRLFSEEKKNKTDILLYTSPVPLYKAVLGKYLAALTLLMIMLSVTLIQVFMTIWLGGLIDAAVLGSYLTLIFIGALFISIGIMTSAVTENQIIAAVFSAVIIIFTMMIQSIAVSAESIFVSIAGAVNPLSLSLESINKAGENIGGAINWLDPFSRIYPLQTGVISIGPMLFCVGMAIFFLFLTYRILEKKRWSKGDRRTRAIRNTSIGSVLILTAIIIVTVILFDNVVGEKLKWDLSSSKTNSITEISKGILSKMNENVEIVGLFELTKEAEVKYTDFVPLLSDYEAKSNGHITVRYVDPVKYPSIMKGIDPNSTQNAQAGSFVIKCGNKIKTVNPSECYNYDEQAYYQYGAYVATSNNVEFNFTGAISFVTSDTVTKAYFTTNHKEAAHVQLKTLLFNNGIEVADFATVGLSVIPDDCSLLIIDDPLEDVSVSDVLLLNNYLARGGKLIVISGYESSDLNFTNLNEVLHTMNLNITNSRIKENDMAYLLQSTNSYLSYADVAVGTFAPAKYDKAIISAFNRAIDVFDNSQSNVLTEALIVSSSKAVTEANGDTTKTGAPGLQNIAMYSSKTSGTVKGEAVVIGTTYLTSDAYINESSQNDQNVQFFNSIAQKLTGSVNTTQVKVKPMPSYILKTVPTANMQAVMSVVLIAAVPLVFLVTGIVIYKKRRNM